MWTECNYRMPPEGEQVLIRIRGEKRYEVGRWVPCDGWWNCYTHFRYDREVSHWMPILDIDDKSIVTTLQWTKTSDARTPKEGEYLGLYPECIRPIRFVDNGCLPFAWASMPDLGPISPGNVAAEVWMHQWLQQLPHVPTGPDFKKWIDSGWDTFWRDRPIAEAFLRLHDFFWGHDGWADEMLPHSVYMSASQKCLRIAVENFEKSSKYGERKLAEMIRRAQQSIEKGKQNEQA